jgi:PEGA domain
MDAPALHPPDQTLCSYGLGKLDADAAESVNKHLESCPECRCRVAELSSDGFLGRLREAQARPDSPSPTDSSVGKMMAKEPECRFQEPMEVAQALKPFFKAGNVGAVGSKPEVSQAGQRVTRPATAGVSPVRTRLIVQMAPASSRSARRRSEPTQPEPMWESLIDLRQQHPLFDMALDRNPPSSAPALCRRGQRAWSTAVTKLSQLRPRHWWAAAGLLLLGLVVVWAGVLRLRSSNGTIELVNLPKDAEVFVDGEEVTVTLPGGVKPAVVTVTAGKHKIMVKMDGLETSGDEVTVQAEGKVKFTVRLLAPTKPLHERPTSPASPQVPDQHAGRLADEPV